MSAMQMQLYTARSERGVGPLLELEFLTGISACRVYRRRADTCSGVEQRRLDLPVDERKACVVTLELQAELLDAAHGERALPRVETFQIGKRVYAERPLCA